MFNFTRDDLHPIFITNFNLDRDFTTGGLVGIVIGCLILLAILGGLFHAAFQRHKRTAVKDIIKAAYQEDFLIQRKLSQKMM